MARFALMQPQDSYAPRWSPDLQWWWDGVQWVPAARAPIPPPPSFAPYAAMPPSFDFAPSPGLRPFLMVALAIDSALTGLLALFGTIGEYQNFSDGQRDVGGVVLWLVFVVLFVLAVVALVGVGRRSSWARWGALGGGGAGGPGRPGFGVGGTGIVCP